MKKDKLLQRQLVELHFLARFQRGLRLGLRSLWLLLTGVLFGWGANTLWGWLPDSRTWLFLGLALGLLPLVGFVASLRRQSQWVWLLDRRLRLDEQVSTAWEVAEKRQPSLVARLLVADVIQLVPRLRGRMLQKGWFLERDLVALMIVMSLGLLVLLSTLIKPYSAPLSEPALAAALPQISDEPRAEEVLEGQAQDQEGAQSDAPGANNPSTEGQERFPKQAPQPGSGESETGQPGSGQADSGQSESGQPGPDRASQDSGNSAALQEALGKLGTQLKDQAANNELGLALEDMDLEGAARELEGLAEQLEGLSPETKDQLAQALEESAGDVDAAGQPGLAQDMSSAAGALEQQSRDSSRSTESARQGLDQLARDLRDLGQEMQAAQNPGQASGAGPGGSGGTGSPEPAARLQGEGGNMELPLEGPADPSGLLSPAPPGAAGPGTASGSLDATQGSSEGVVDSFIVPNHFLWKWRDVVSSYFQR